MKYYAVKQGRQVGIFTSWDECRRQVTGYKGAEFKGFTSREDAENFIGGSADNSVLPEAPDCPAPSEDTVIAYVDGSYNVKTKIFACGVVLITSDGEIHLNNSFNDEELASMRNVAGEIKGSMAAMEYCVKNNIANLHIFYDYEGIEKWCTGAWKTNKQGTIEYRDYYNSIKNKINVAFHKVKGHSGDKYNDLADRLAKDAAGIR